MKPQLNKEKISSCVDQVLDVFNQARMNVGEIIIALGNITYALGASVGGYKNKGPSVSELQQKYYSQPDISTALMIQGIQMTTWYDDLNKTETEQLDQSTATEAITNNEPEEQKEE